MTELAVELREDRTVRSGIAEEAVGDDTVTQRLETIGELCLCAHANEVPESLS